MDDAAAMSSRDRTPPDEPRDVGELTFRIARSDDVPQIVEILTEAAVWAKERGIERWWAIPFPEGWVRSGVSRGEVYAVELGSQMVGTLTLAKQDRLMWGEGPPDAGYIHRLAIRRQFAHQGLGKRAVDWAAAEVRRWGRTKLRLDCLATNESLVRYYRNQGFREVGRIQGNVPGEDRPSVLMERSVQ